MTFYICKHCGNIIESIKNTGTEPSCCGQEMAELIPGSVDAALEKHVPEVQRDGLQITVTVGAVEHPMLPAHYIEWIALETLEGIQRKPLLPGQKPQAVFALTDTDSPVTAYAFCNLHGLWKADTV